MVTQHRSGSVALYWATMGLVVVVAGCQLQIAFVDSNTKQTPAPPITPPARSATAMNRAAPELQQVSANYQGSAVMAPGTGVVMPGTTMMPGTTQMPSMAPPTGGIASMPGGIMPGPMPGQHPAVIPGHIPGPVMGPVTGPMAGPVHPGPLVHEGGPGGMHNPMTGVVPTEKAKTSLPPYMIEPPDILLIDPVRLVPKPPYTVQALDVLLVRVAETLPNQPIDGPYTVGPEGNINLGFSYGAVRVGGLTLEDVERAIRAKLNGILKDPQVAVGLAQFRGIQQVRGEHLVRMDGTISLGSYGCVYVAGLTLAQAKVAVERHLCQYLQDPEVSVDVFAYNSKAYYIITDGAGFGQSVFRLPITGNETVLDAISQIQGLPAVASQKKIWVARPAPANHECAQILPVDWKAITQGGVTATNYQIFPGDRIYVHSDFWICADNTLAKFLAPFERIFGITLLGATTVQAIANPNAGQGGVGFIAPLR